MAGCTIGCHFLVCSFVGCFPPVVQKLAYNCIHSCRGYAFWYAGAARSKAFWSDERDEMRLLIPAGMFLVIDGG